MKKQLTILMLVLFMGAIVAQAQERFVSTTPSKKQILIEEFTGVNCGYCPDGHRICNQLMDMNPEQIYVMNVHQGSFASQYKTEFGDQLAYQAGLHSYPSATINRHKFGTSIGVTNRGSWAGDVKMLSQDMSPVNIAAKGTLDWATRTLTLTVQLYYTADSKVETNALNVAVLQDNILGSQSGGSNYNPSQMVNGKYNHMHMLRYFITGQWGETIGTTKAGTFVEKQYTYVIPEKLGNPGPVVAELEDLNFLCFVAEGKTEILAVTEAEITNVNVQGIPDIAPTLVKVEDRGVSNFNEGGAVNAVVKNYGAAEITSMSIKYSVGSGAAQIFEWTGSVKPLETATIELPAFDLEPNVTKSVNVTLVSVNGTEVSVPSKKVDVIKHVVDCGGYMFFTFKVDRYASENSFRFTDENGKVIVEEPKFENLPSFGTKAYKYSFMPTKVGMYLLEAFDTYGDGMNMGQGAGGMLLTNYDETISYINDNGKFGKCVRYYLNVTEPSAIDDKESGISIYPNPAVNTVNIAVEGSSVESVALYNLQGQMIQFEQGDVHSMDISSLASGIYMMKVVTENGAMTTQKIVKK